MDDDKAGNRFIYRMRVLRPRIYIEASGTISQRLTAEVNC